MRLEYITKENAPTEAEILQFMKMPLVLFRSPEWKQTLSISAKVLYCFLLDRSNLSLKNPESFTDSSGRAFIFFSWEEAMDTLQCGRQKVSKVFKELEQSELIERVHRGLGKSPKIYVKRFYNETETVTKTEAKQEAVISSEYENHTREYENHTRYIESNLHNQTYPCFGSSSEAEEEPAKAERKKGNSTYEESVEKAKHLLASEKTNQFGSRKLAELCEILAWVLKTSKKALKIGGISVKTQEVREKLWSMTADQAAEVLENTDGRRIGNRRNYLLTCLYNASLSDPYNRRSASGRTFPKCENADIYKTFFYNI